MKNKLMTNALCTVYECDEEDLQLNITLNPCVDRIKKAMHYYAKALIESLTDEEISKASLLSYGGSEYENGLERGFENGAEWEREELLKRNAKSLTD